MRSGGAAVLLFLLAVGAAGCKKKEHCERLVQTACDRLTRETKGAERCDQLRAQAESVDDEQ